MTTVRKPLVLIPNGNPQIQELPVGDSIAGVLAGTTATGATGASGTNGASALQYTTTVGDGSSTTFTVTHNLGTKDVVVTVRKVSDDTVTARDWTATSTSAISITISPAPALNAYTVLVVAGNAVGSGVTPSVNIYFA